MLAHFKKLSVTLPKWIPSISLFGITAGTALCYATDWKVVVGNIPYYSGKFKAEEES